ncbi:hypothetical protein SLS53_003493 [Cytospora paraplurivora]|uniref:Uncharacterized protein n=1 Tax=Cytospora paraplurivora TaxID=2898453 RepID=A0AAN9UB97_9PEZI
MFFQETQTIQSEDVRWWSCPEDGCELNMTLHWALKSRQEDALLQGQAYSSILPYLPLLISDEGDEACELALSPEEVSPATWCPNPDYLSAEDRLMALEMLQKGETVLKVANVLGKAYQAVCKYIGAYIRPNLKLFVSESRRADEGEERRDNEQAAGNEEVEKEVDEPPPSRVIHGPPEPVPGAPDPDWLSADERRLLREMRRRGESKRAIAEALGKGYVRLIKYINAYVVPWELAARHNAPKKRKRSEESQPEIHYGARRYSKRVRRQEVESQSDSESQSEHQSKPRRFSKRIRQLHTYSESRDPPRRSERTHQQKTGANFRDCIVVRG